MFSSAVSRWSHLFCSPVHSWWTWQCGRFLLPSELDWRTGRASCRPSHTLTGAMWVIWGREQYTLTRKHSERPYCYQDQTILQICYFFISVIWIQKGIKVNIVYRFVFIWSSTAEDSETVQKSCFWKCLGHTWIKRRTKAIFFPPNFIFFRFWDSLLINSQTSLATIRRGTKINNDRQPAFKPTGMLFFVLCDLKTSCTIKSIILTAEYYIFTPTFNVGRRNTQK